MVKGAGLIIPGAESIVTVIALLAAQVAVALVNKIVWSVEDPFPAVTVAEPHPAEVHPVISETDTSPAAIELRSKPLLARVAAVSGIPSFAFPVPLLAAGIVMRSVPPMGTSVAVVKEIARLPDCVATT